MAETYVNENAHRVVVVSLGTRGRQKKVSGLCAGAVGILWRGFNGGDGGCGLPVGAVFASDDELADAAEELHRGLKGLGMFGLVRS